MIFDGSTSDPFVLESTKILEDIGKPSFGLICVYLVKYLPLSLVYCNIS